jgi:hypothetical protein
LILKIAIKLFKENNKRPINTMSEQNSISPSRAANVVLQIREYSKTDDSEKNKLLVERVESIVSAETSKYFTIHQPEKVQQRQQQQHNEAC